MNLLRHNPLVRSLRALHEDEDGIETIQVVMILGIAAVVLIVLWNFFPGIRKWVKDFVTKLIGINPNSDTIQ